MTETDSVGRPQRNPSLRWSVWVAVGLLAVTVAFGGLPRSRSVRTTEARIEQQTSATVVPTTTTTTTTPPVPEALDVGDLATLVTESGYPDVEVTIGDAGVVLGGTLPDEASRRVVLTIVGGFDPSLVVVDEMTVVVADLGGDASIDATPQRITLAGSVSDQATAQAVLDAVERVYQTDQIDGAITIDPTRTSPARVAARITASRPELAEQLRTELDAIDPALALVETAIEITDPAPVEADLAALLDASPILFASGSDAIDSESAAVLDQIAAVLARYPDVALEVGGHTDDLGGDRANQQLSEARAQAVVEALVELGVANDLDAVGYGELRPKVRPADDPEAREANRRIEFVVRAG